MPKVPSGNRKGKRTRPYNPAKIIEEEKRNKLRLASQRQREAAKKNVYSEKWFNHIVQQHNTHLKGSAPVVDAKPVSATIEYAWTRILDNTSVVTQAEFETARSYGQETTKPCGYAVAIDITGYDEWTTKANPIKTVYRAADTQIYHMDSAHLVGAAHDFRIDFWVGVPVTESQMGMDRAVVVAPAQKTVYPDCSPSYTGNLSIGHTIKHDERRPEFYKYYGEGKFRRYMQVGVYSPTVSGDTNSGDVGSAKLRMKARCLKYDSGVDLSSTHLKRIYPHVIDYPIYDPALVSGPVGTDGGSTITVVQDAGVSVAAGATGKYYVTLADNALDAVAHDDAVYKLDRPIYVNASTTAGTTPQPAALRYFRQGLITGHTGGPKKYLFAHIADAMTMKEMSGIVTGSTYSTSNPIRMFKEVNSAGVACGGKGLSSVVNVAHSGLTAPNLKRYAATAAKASDGPFSVGNLLDDPRVIHPEGTITKIYGQR